MKALDLFRGAGGWSVACQRLDIEDWGVEIMPQANATAELAGHKTAWHDVWEPQSYDFDALIASPPCQTFSAAGKGSGRKALDDVLAAVRDGSWKSIDRLREVGASVGDERTALVLSPLHYWWKIRPQWVAFEQVPTVLPVWEACAEEMRAEGYSVWTGNLQAEQYGVPQTRRRAFLIASRERVVRMPTPTHSKYYSRSPEKLDAGVEKWVSMAEALPNRADHTLRTGVNSAIVGPGPKRDQLMAEGRWRECHKPQERPTSAPSPTITSQTSGWVTDPLPEWSHHRPSTTIVGSFKPEIVAAPGYRTTVSRQNAPDSVRVSVQEAGVLQSFPADYDWQGAKTKQYLQVGNAVPPLLAEAVLRVASGA